MTGTCFAFTLLLSASAAFGFCGFNDEFLGFSADEGKENEVLSFRKRSISQNERTLCQEGSESPKNRVDSSDRLRRLRLRMKASSYDAYIMPHNDEHQSEFITDYDGRLQFISGFSGSWGTAVVLQNKSALWTDGRYFLQADQELDCKWMLMKLHTKGTPSVREWLVRELGPRSNIGIDPRLITEYQWAKWEEELKKTGLNLQEDKSNLIDDIWSIGEGRTPEPAARVYVHSLQYAGMSWQDKIKDLRQKLLEKEANGTIISALDEIAWLFNLRGSEFPYAPLFKAYAFVSQEHIRFYIKPLKLTDDVKKHLDSSGCNNATCVQIKKYSETFNDIRELLSKTDEKILVSYYSSHSIVKLVPREVRVNQKDSSPVADIKAIKNPVEIQGMKSAHLRDVVAIVDFIAKLEKEVNAGKPWDEFKASKRLKGFRAEQELNKGESFETISAFGPNGAIVHYSPHPTTNRAINNSSLYLLDSGGQYLDGTTDITRTFHFGTPSDFEKEAYTRVLMGSINLMSTIFPDGVRDSDVDILARQPLYESGLLYNHGTGHGIGSFLSVHEGPFRISNPALGQKKGYALKPGMFMSVEPGYYEDGKFGIRLETIVMVVSANPPHKFKNTEFYTFEPVSLIPFEPKLIKYELLTNKQKQWLNEFNIKVRNSIGVELRRQKRENGFQWLLSRTEHILTTEYAGSGNKHTMSNTVYLLILFSVYVLIL